MDKDRKLQQYSNQSLQCIHSFDTWKQKKLNNSGVHHELRGHGMENDKFISILKLRK